MPFGQTDGQTDNKHNRPKGKSRLVQILLDRLLNKSNSWSYGQTDVTDGQTDRRNRRTDRRNRWTDRRNRRTDRQRNVLTEFGV